MKYAKPLLTILAIGISFLVGLGFGTLKPQKELSRGDDACSLMFLTGIHEHLVEGDYEGAKKITESAAQCYVGAIDSREQQSLWHLLRLKWFMLTSKETPDLKVVSDHWLNRAFDHFSKYPNSLPPEEMTYLEKFKEVKSPTTSPRP